MLRQEVKELGVYSAIIEAIAGGATKSNEIVTKTGEELSVWSRRIEPDYPAYMGIVFERVCREYLLWKNSTGELPVLFTSVGRWWGTDPATRRQVEIDLVAGDGVVLSVFQNRLPGGSKGGSQKRRKYHPGGYRGNRRGV